MLHIFCVGLSIVIINVMYLQLKYPDKDYNGKEKYAVGCSRDHYTGTYNI